VVGAGTVGLSTIHEVTERRPHLRVVTLEKEHDVPLHPTGYHSGVAHRGID
jgi:L-2-hydroxyglutarate oxidase LhgO